MNLDELRGLVGNKSGYSPDTAAYNADIDQLIGNVYADVFGMHEWTFSQKEARVTAHGDVAATDLVVTNSDNHITTTAAFFASWMEGQLLEVRGAEYEIGQVVSTTSAYLSAVWTGTTSPVGGEAATAKQRYVDLPEDCQQVSQIGTYEYVSGDTNRGRFVPLTRFEGEHYSLSLAQTGVPTHWLPADPVTTRAPIRVTLGTNAGGAWTSGSYDFKVSLKRAGRYSSPTSATFTHVADGSAVRPAVTLVTTGTGSGYRYAVWCRPPGYSAYRLYVDDLSGAGGTTVLATEPPAAWEFNARMTEAGGHTQRMRLYPRPSEDVDLTVRYILRPPKLIEDSDTPIIPEGDQKVIAEIALTEVYAKSDQLAQSEVYRRKGILSLAALEGRYLTSRPRRWVKQGWTESAFGTRPQITIVHG